MSTSDFATFGAAFLGIASLIALTVFYVSFGLDRPTHHRTRLAAFLMLGVSGIGYSIEWLIEATAGHSGQVNYWAGLRTLLGLTMLNFAYALYRDGKEPTP